MNNKEKYNFYKESVDKLEDIKNSKKEDLDDAILEYEKICYGLSYEKLVEGWVVEKDIMLDTFEFYSRIKDNVKANYVAFMLNKYYDGFLTEKLNEYINTENYENCELLKNFINVKDMPSIT